MRVPVTNPQSISAPSSNPKLFNTSPQNVVVHSTPTTIIPTLCYEPTSVLDLRRSPSPPAPENPLQNHPPSATDWDEQALHNLDWDSIIGDLGLHEDSNSCHQVPQFPDLLHPQPFDQDQQPFISPEFYLSDHPVQTFNSFDLPNQTGFDFVEDIIRAADCFDSNNLQLAHVILDRLNQRLPSPVGKPLQRAGFFFKEALQLLLAGSTRSNRPTPLPEIIHTIKAYKAFSAISPIPMFSHFTTNQALLESLSGSSFIHIIDFEIGFGGQYASFMKELAGKHPPPVLRITAVVQEEFAAETRLIRENLFQFAYDLKLRFHIDLVPFRTFETMSFKSVKFMEGEKTAVLITPAILRRVNGVGSFLGDVRRVSPAVVVFVDGEGWSEGGTASFKRSVVDGLEFYAVMMETVDAAAAGGEWGKRIERFVFRPKIMAAVAAADRVEAADRMAAPAAWREVFYGAGLSPVALSQFADFQAECLLGKVQVRGFQVGKRQAELVLCWHQRPLVAMSAWR